MSAPELRSPPQRRSACRSSPAGTPLRPGGRRVYKAAAVPWASVHCPSATDCELPWATGRTSCTGSSSAACSPHSPGSCTRDGAGQAETTNCGGGGCADTGRASRQTAPPFPRLAAKWGLTLPRTRRRARTRRQGRGQPRSHPLPLPAGSVALHSGGRAGGSGQRGPRCGLRGGSSGRSFCGTWGAGRPHANPQGPPHGNPSCICNGLP